MSEKNEIDPRVRQLSQGRSPFERFVLFALALLMPPDVMSAAMQEITPQGTDLNEEVEGKPLHHWLGKTEEQLLRETNGDKTRVAAIKKVMKSRELEPAKETQLVVDDAGMRVGIKGKGEPTSATGKSQSESDLRGSNEEPTFGDEQIPLSEFDGMTDEQILEVKGVGPATLKEIREALDARSKQ